MDVEYQKKEVTWCLDRVGPRICLKAIAINDKLKQLEMTSDEFKLTLENDEAREFLGIIQNIVSTKPETIPLPVPEAEPSPLEEFIEKPIEKPIEIAVETPVEEFLPVPETKEVEPKTAIKLDTAEILEVLKQSESSVEEERISFRKKFAENEALAKETTPQLQPEQEIEESELGISIEEKVRPSEIFKEKLDTASFFREVEEKSPLEQLLEETEDRTEDYTTVDPPMSDTRSVYEEEGSLPESDSTVPFSPDDLDSSSFLSKFSSKPFEQEIETKKEESVENIVDPDLSQQDTESVQQSGFQTEEDRKKEIERERAARKKRLWELTRGF